MARIQFILKARETEYSDETADVYEKDPVTGKQYLSSGLLNSAKFVQEMLATQLGHTTEISQAIDNNDLDRLVTAFKPDICIIEAYWVVPEKFDVLYKLHPNMLWIIRNHSATPFAANEGIVMDWSLRYMDYPNVMLCCNDFRTDAEMRALISIYKPDWSSLQLGNRVSYLPNYYPSTVTSRVPNPNSDFLDVSCFGALRPLKNHLIQAIAAIKVAETLGKTLRFHINSTRVEMQGAPVYHNLNKMFSLITKHKLVEHSWLPHEAFKTLVRQMDIAMQVSYTETFNIVTADAVCGMVPVVVSSDIKWIDPCFFADPNNSDNITDVMLKTLALGSKDSCWQTNQAGLEAFNIASVRIWRDFINSVL